jgi:hypothetical protein
MTEALRALPTAVPHPKVRDDVATALDAAVLAARGSRGAAGEAIAGAPSAS